LARVDRRSEAAAGPTGANPAESLDVPATMALPVRRQERDRRMESGDNGRMRQHGRRLAAGSLAAVAALAVAGGASGATLRAVKLTAPEAGVRQQYKKLVPNLDKAQRRRVQRGQQVEQRHRRPDLGGLHGAAKQWASATAPLAALKAPSPVAAIFAR